MIELPPVPSWSSLHPLIVHFPIALLITAPLFILVGLFLHPPRRFAFELAGGLLMALGTLASALAVETGEAAGRIAERSPAINSVLLRHAELAETTRGVFVVMTLVFVAVALAASRLDRGGLRVAAASVMVLFLAFYGAALVLLVDTAHNGGRLVHELGVRAEVPVSAPAPAARGGGVPAAIVSR